MIGIRGLMFNYWTEFSGELRANIHLLLLAMWQNIVAVVICQGEVIHKLCCLPLKCTAGGNKKWTAIYGWKSQQEMSWNPHEKQVENLNEKGMVHSCTLWRTEHKLVIPLHLYVLGAKGNN